jgi:AbrB family looped-hinge helix DNA binding protein
MRPRARVTSRGQVTIPKNVRERLGLKPGDEIEFVEDRGGFRLQKHVAVSILRKYRGHLKHLAGRDPDELVERMRDR